MDLVERTQAKENCEQGEGLSRVNIFEWIGISILSFHHALRVKCGDFGKLCRLEYVTLTSLAEIKAYQN